MNIIIAGCGRMGQGIAITYALAGYQIQLIDMKERNSKNFNLLLDQTITKLNSDIKFIKTLDLKPDECKMYHCSFISEAYKVRQTHPEEQL
ncbi:MAG: hypothetical protein HN930_03625, partial [Pelagibacterales bacterium]|nr:hypothetical protein [Pelagibacterales bacterium]